ncbi:unnamed protein product [Eruca vesicaria subsp. sativa]|uniref:F-box domain-containing protein n=1 Tax=Eruca vesicaria subsp. sativa TaxID=29727 RepID=A0ABC8JLS5_ERUVS|nr:unnamed protein product [Eruca vesicaria subsp. sativa]
MSTAADSNAKEPTQEEIHRALSSMWSLFTDTMRRAIHIIYKNKYYSLSSLPDDLVLNCLARVPTRYDPTLACVCKNFQSLVLSSELAQMRRSLLAMKDYPLLCVFNIDSTRRGWKTFHWVTFNLKEKKTSPPKSVDIKTTQNMYTCPTVSLGSKIYFVGGSDWDAEGSSGLVIFDSRSGELSKGPSMKAARKGAGVAVVDGKIYVTGGFFNFIDDEIIQVEVFDPNTQTWEVGPLGPHGEMTYGEGFKITQFRDAVALDGMVYGISFSHGHHTIYDTKDGTCENFDMSYEYTEKIRKVCVINSLIYAIYYDLGLMWYDPKEKIWRRVKGLPCDVWWHRMVECNGKLVLLREDSEKKIWCAMIALDKVGVEIHGRVEWSEFVLRIPGDAHPYIRWSCLGLSL